MGFIDTMLNAMGYHKQQPAVVVEQKGAVGPLKDDLTIYRSLRSLVAQFDEVTHPYSQSIWVYASVNAIASNISRVPFNQYKWLAKEQRQIEEGPFYELFQKPNPYMSPEQLWEATLIYLGLRGESMWIIERNNVTEIPKEIWVFDPIRFTPMIHETSGMLAGWKYKGKTEEVFAPWEVLHFKYFNPDDDLRGMPPLQAAKMGVNQDYYASRYNEAFFKEGARVGGFVQVAESLDDQQYNRLIASFEERHKGFNKAHRIGILEGGATFTEAKMSQKDMDFVSLKKLTREEIFAAYKTNAVVLGLYDQIQSYEGIKTAHKAFWLECLVPKIKYIAGVVNTRLTTPISGKNIWWEFDLATVESLQEDFNKKVDTGYKMWQMGYPINAVNDRLNLGMPRQKWGDVWWAPLSLIPVDSPENPNPPAPTAAPAPSKPAKSPHGEGQGEGEIVTQKAKQEGDVSVKLLIDSAKGGAAWKNLIAGQTAVEKKVRTSVRTFFFNQRKKVLANLYERYSQKTVSKVKDLSDELINFDEESAKLAKTLTPLYQLAVKVGAESIATELGIADFVFNPLEPEYQAYMAMKVQNIPAMIVDTLKDRLRITLTEGLAKGESVDQLADRVRAEYNMANTRALTIARTETATAANGGRVIQMRKEGVKRHQWLTAGDEVVRHTHRILDGSVANLGDYFKTNVGNTSPLKYPGDPGAPGNEVINCRCITLPVVGKTS